MSEFDDFELGDSPRLIIGWRNSEKHLEAFRVKLDEDLKEVLIELCAPSLEAIRNYEERRWENFAALDDEEYFWYKFSDLPNINVKSMRKQPPPENNVEGSGAWDLIDLVKLADELPYVNRARLADGGFTFYAICWNYKGSIVGFVSHMNPVSMMRQGIKYFQFGEVMRKVDAPSFALSAGSDLVVGLSGLAIFNSSAFLTLFGDRSIAFSQVSKDLTSIKKILAKSVRLSAKGENSLKQKSITTQKYARRLSLLPDRLKAITLTPAQLKSVLKKHGVNHKLILENDEFSFEEKDISIFFDAIESRFFKDEFSPEKRKADRFSTRK